MSTTQFISVRETAQILSVSEKKVMDLIEERKLQAYKIADKFLRLKKSDVLSIKNTDDFEEQTKNIPYTFADKVKDFCYFNDFYILCIIMITSLLYIIFYT